MNKFLRFGALISALLAPANMGLAATGPHAGPGQQIGLEGGVGAVCIIGSDTTCELPISNTNLYKHISTSTTTLVKTGPGTLHRICINTLGTVASTVEADDAVTHAAPVIVILNSLTTGQGCYDYDITFATGLSVTTTGTAAPDITVSYQ